MIKRKIYFLVGAILTALIGTYIFAVIMAGRVDRKINDRTVKAINNTVGTITVRRVNYMLEVFSEKLAGKTEKKQRDNLKKILEPFKQFQLERYTQCVIDKEGVPVYLFSSETPEISTDMQNKPYREFTTRFQKLKKKGGGFYLYSNNNGSIPVRFIHVSKIKGSPFWHCIDIDLNEYIKSITGVFTILEELNRVHRRMLHIIAVSFFIFILLISIYTTKEISGYEKEKKEQNEKLVATNTLLEIEVNIRKQIEQDLKKINSELKLISLKDGLTGIANRRYYEEYTANEWERMARERKPLTLLLCDIDYFKKYNDAYGHLEGDECLKLIAEAINRSCKRPADLAARFGGEEFIVVLPDTDTEGGKLVAESIRTGIENLKVEHYDSPEGIVTISIGIASTIPVHGQECRSLVQEADEALYRAKQNGRNRIETG
ncbi:MAG TPA: diguanylate cyclase [Spirochaetota bacterium]|nr:diguanylate cyclase [Spirochaetota bacterium]